jgi:hypothetical protein
VPYLDVLELVLVLPPDLEDAVDAVAGKGKDSLNAQVEEALDQEVGHGLRDRYGSCWAKGDGSIPGHAPGGRPAPPRWARAPRPMSPRAMSTDLLFNRR